MKNIYILLFTCLTMISCGDFLDTESSTGLPAGEAISSLNDRENALNGVYYTQTGNQYARGNYAGDFTIHADLLGGDFSPKRNVNQIGPVGQYSVDASHDVTKQYYFIFYKSLARINNILSVIDNVSYDKENADEVAKYTDFKGQLYAMRALLHFDLARLYAKLPTSVADLNAPNSGIVISDQVFDADYRGVRATLKQTYDFILADLDKALPLLSKNKKLGAINYWAAKGIQARAFLYLDQNKEALSAAKEIIENNTYKLYSIAEYPSVWVQEGTSESIFELLITTVYNAQRNSLGYYTSASGYGECGLTDSFNAFLDARPNDIRSTLKEEQSPGIFYPKKYPGRGGEIYVNNPKIIRLSEVYLIAAEADFKINGASGASAIKYINDLRTNRISGYTAVTSVTLDDILTERRLELYTEGHNAWDYWRNKQSIFNATVNEVKYSDNRTILQIPAREIAMNSKLVQNPK